MAAFTDVTTRTQRRQVDGLRRRRGGGGQLRVALGVQLLRPVVQAVDPERQAIVTVDGQFAVQRDLAVATAGGKGQRPQPHHVPQRDLPRRQFAGPDDRFARQFKVGGSGEHQPIADAVIGQERLAAAEAAHKTLPRQGRHIAMHQRVQMRHALGGERRGLLAVPADVGPVVLAGERITRQGQARWRLAGTMPDRGKQPASVDVVPLAITVRQPGQQVPDLAVSGVATVVQQLIEIADDGLLGGKGAIDLAGEQVGTLFSGQILLEAVARLLQVRRHQRQAMAEMVPSFQQGVTDRRQLIVAVAALLQRRTELFDACRQRLGGLGGEHEQVAWPPERRGVALADVAFQHDVGIGAAHAKGADSTQPLAVAACPRPGLVGLVDVERAGLPVDVVVFLLAVQAGRDGVVAERLQQADHADQARGCKGMADIGLGRGQCAVARPAAPERVVERIDLHRIPQLRAGAVGDDVFHGVDVDSRAPVDRLQQALLGGAAGRGDAVGLAVVVDAAAAQHAVDPVAVGLGPGQRLEHHAADRFARHHAVGPAIEGVALAVRRQHPRLGHADEGIRREDQVHAGGDRHLALVVAQARCRLVQRHQRRRTGGVDRHGRPGQVEEIGQPRRQDAVVARGQALVAGQPLEVALLDADEHADPLRLQVARTDARILQRVPGFLQQQPLPGVQCFGFTGRYLEKQRIELTDARHAAHPDAAGLAGILPVIAVVVAPVVAIRRDFADRVTPLDLQPPQLIRVAGAGKAAADPDDRDRAGIRRWP